MRGRARGRSRRLAAAALTGVLASTLSGCALFTSPAETPHGEAVRDWVELLCEGQYSLANEGTSNYARIDSSWYDAEGFDHNLALLTADGQAFERLVELESQGVDVEPRIRVESAETAGSSDDLALVEVSGECFGMEFEETVSAIYEGGTWRINDHLPLFGNDQLVRGGGTGIPYVRVEIPTGTYFESIDPLRSGWLLPPGEHTLTVPPHFLTGDAIDLDIKVSVFAVADDPMMITFHTDSVDDALAAFREECGAVCAVPASGVSDSGTFAAEELTVTPLEVDADGRVTYSGAVAVVQFDGMVAEWRTVLPLDWGLDTPNTARGSLDGDIGWAVQLSCPEGETCTFTPGEGGGGEVGALSEVHFADVDGSVKVSGLQID